MAHMTPDTATSIAISGLQYIAGDEEQLTRFIALTGISPDEMRKAAGTESFLIAILEFFMGDEPTLLAFTASQNIDPSDVQKALYTLSPPGLNSGDTGW
jgi:hypothetical protein